MKLIVILSLVALICSACQKQDEKVDSAEPDVEIPQGDQEGVAAALRASNLILTSLDETSTEPLGTPEEEGFKGRLKAQIQKGDCVVSKKGSPPPPLPESPEDSISDFPEGQHPFDFVYAISGEKCFLSFQSTALGQVRKQYKVFENQPSTTTIVMKLDLKQQLTFKDEEAKRTYDLESFKLSKTLDYNNVKNKVKKINLGQKFKVEFVTLTQGDLSVTAQNKGHLNWKEEKLVDGQLQRTVELKIRNSNFRTQSLIQMRGTERGETYKINGKAVSGDRYAQQVGAVLLELPGH